MLLWGSLKASYWASKVYWCSNLLVVNDGRALYTLTQITWAHCKSLSLSPPNSMQCQDTVYISCMCGRVSKAIVTTCTEIHWPLIDYDLTFYSTKLLNGVGSGSLDFLEYLQIHALHLKWVSGRINGFFFFVYMVLCNRIGELMHWCIRNLKCTCQRLSRKHSCLNWQNWVSLIISSSYRTLYIYPWCIKFSIWILSATIQCQYKMVHINHMYH